MSDELGELDDAIDKQQFLEDMAKVECVIVTGETRDASHSLVRVFVSFRGDPGTGQSSAFRIQFSADNEITQDLVRYLGFRASRGGKFGSMRSPIPGKQGP